VRFSEHRDMDTHGEVGAYKVFGYTEAEEERPIALYCSVFSSLRLLAVSRLT
jgi:hypothetical protein